MEKTDNVQEQMGHVSRELEILRKNQKEMLEIKSRHLIHLINHLR